MGGNEFDRPGPRALTENVGWMLRTVPGRNRNFSVIAPVVEGVERASNRGSDSQVVNGITDDG